MIFLAVRYLLERKRQTFLTLLGVFFGTMAYVGVSGFFLGFQGFMVTQLVNNTAQVHIQAHEDSVGEHELDEPFYGKGPKHVFWVTPVAGVSGYPEVQSPEAWYARLKADPRVEAFSPLTTEPVLFTLGKLSQSASLIGCDPAAQAKVTSVADYMDVGKFTDIAVGGNRVIMGAELMRRLGAGVGEMVQVTAGGQPPQPVQIVGRFYTGSRGADMQAYAALADVQRIAHAPNQVTEIAVRLKDYTQAAALARNWTKIAPERTESWDQQNANILSMFAIQTALRYSMIATVLLVAGFGIYNVLNMSVNQKRQDIAILRSMGYDTFDVASLFFSQGMILGLIGAALGLLSGYLLCRYLQTIPFQAATPRNPSGHMHISLDVWIYVQATFLALLSASLASILPARAAGKLTPIEIIRSGA